MLNKLRTQADQFVQCKCLAAETLPLYLGNLDGHKIGDEIFYGKFKQVNGNIYHNCGEGIWCLCQKIPKEVSK